MDAEKICKILPMIAWALIIGVLSFIAKEAGDWSLLFKGLLLVVIIMLIDKQGRKTLGNTWLRTVISLCLLFIVVVAIF